nr:hypothetical protein [Tanacetum cinerariifolium]
MSKAFDDIQERELHHLQLMQENAKESCMTSFRLLHSFLQVLSYNESKSRIVSKRAFMTLFGQDNETFTSMMFLNLDQLQRQLDKDKFKEDKSMVAFWVIDNQFQKFIDWQYFMDYDSQMTEKFFAEYTGIKVTQFRETLLQHMGNVKKSVTERAHHQRQYERRHWMPIWLSWKAMGQSGMHDTSSSSGNYITHVVDANIRPVNDQVPFAEVQLTGQHNVLANEQQHTNQSEPIYDTYLLEKVDRNTSPSSTNISHRGGEINQDAEHDQVKSPLLKAENSSNESYGSNDMAHKYYLEVAKKKTQDKNTSLKPSVRHTTSLQNTTNGSKPKPRSNNLTSRSFPIPRVVVVNSHVKVQSPKNRNINKHIEPESHTQKTSRQIAIGQRFSLNKSSAVREKPNTLRSCLSTTKVDSEPPNGSNEDITNPYECKQSLDVSAVSPTPYVFPSKKDYEILFQQLFDEYFNPLPRTVSLVLAAIAAPRAVDLAGSLSSTTIDQDVPSASSSPTT